MRKSVERCGALGATADLAIRGAPRKDASLSRLLPVLVDPSTPRGAPVLGACACRLFMQHGSKLVLLLAGGDKSTQAKDIKTALELAREW